MAEQQLDLLQSAAGLAAEPSACSPEVMGRQVAQLAVPGILPHNPPYGVFGKAVRTRGIALIHAPEERPGVDRGHCDPLIEKQLNPSGWGRRVRGSQAGMGTVRRR